MEKEMARNLYYNHLIDIRRNGDCVENAALYRTKGKGSWVIAIGSPGQGDRDPYVCGRIHFKADNFKAAKEYFFEWLEKEYGVWADNQFIDSYLLMYEYK